MLTRRAMPRRAPAAVLVCAAVALSLTPAQPAAADPGFCGVRAGVSAGANGADVIYTVWNRCDDAHAFKVYLPAPGRTSPCQTVPAQGYAYFDFTFADRDWQVLACQ